MDELIQAIIMVAEKYVKSAPFNHILDGVVVEADPENNLYNVVVNDITYENVPSTGHGNDFVIGDKVYVVIVNNNYSRKLILGKIGAGADNVKIDKTKLPITPVQIKRTADGVAYRFDYGFEGYPPQYQWHQVLHRNDEGQLYMVSEFYSDGEVVMYYLKRNSNGQVEYYGQNSFWKGE